MKQFEQILRDTIGLDAASIGSSMIERAVRLRMKNRNVRKRGEYQQLLEDSESEWRELIEAVVVTETWFFRDIQPFTALAQLVSEQWLPDHSLGKAKILSLPCSSGEEPYSVAMALLDAAVPAERFEIDGVDISDRAVARAERGIFRRNSFRGKQLGFRDRYFQAIREGYALDPMVRKCVRFRVGNLLREDFRAPQPVYDYIFCRNLSQTFLCPGACFSLGRRSNRWRLPMVSSRRKCRWPSPATRMDPGLLIRIFHPRRGEERGPFRSPQLA